RRQPDGGLRPLAADDLPSPADLARVRSHRGDATRDVGVLPGRSGGDRGVARRARRMRRALFVCIGNAGRSQMAQAFYERLGGEARSAGSRPEEELHHAVVEALEEIDVDTSQLHPKPIRAEDVAWA